MFELGALCSLIVQPVIRVLCAGFTSEPRKMRIEDFSCKKKVFDDSKGKIAQLP